MEEERRIGFFLREIHNQIRKVVHRSFPKSDWMQPTQLQAGILGYLYHHRDDSVYQKDLEREFKISRATATNTLQVMERDGFIVRRSLDKDARLKRIQLTDEAYQHHRKVEAHMKMMDRRLLEGMSQEETDELYRLLGILQGNLEKFAEELSGREAAPPQMPPQDGADT